VTLHQRAHNSLLFDGLSSSEFIVQRSRGRERRYKKNFSAVFGDEQKIKHPRRPFRSPIKYADFSVYILARVSYLIGKQSAKARKTEDLKKDSAARAL
jgi:hypothetical protein